MEFVMMGLCSPVSFLPKNLASQLIASAEHSSSLGFCTASSLRPGSASQFLGHHRSKLVVGSQPAFPKLSSAAWIYGRPSRERPIRIPRSSEEFRSTLRSPSSRGVCCRPMASAAENAQLPTPTSTSIVWFRNDLRVHDNEALLLAAGGGKGSSKSAGGAGKTQQVLPVYCFDTRQFSTTHHFGFPKTGAFRAQFLREAVADLRQSLRALGSELIVRVGLPEVVIPQLAAAAGASKVYAQKETTDEEIRVERNMVMALRRAGGAGTGGSGVGPTLELIWGSTMYHLEDLPFSPHTACPDIYTQFRKAVETRCEPRPLLRMPSKLPPIPGPLLETLGGAGELPDLARDLGLTPQEQDPRGVLAFRGGETAALQRIKDYFWTKDKLRVYKETRNGMLGADYSSKFSPWLAHGCLSPRLVHEEVLRYEKERVANDSTYWLLFELIWRDYFRFLSMKCGNTIFKLGGPRNVQGLKWSVDRSLLDAWKEGRTGYPLVDANMRELAQTGWMSNRGRQIVCSFLVRDMGLDWRMGAEWFECLLLDYDPCSNYGNWTYGAGVGTDPREDRYFSIPKQAQNYDPDAAFITHWLPELEALPQSKRHSAYNLTPSERASYQLQYPGPVVKLKMGNFAGQQRGNGGARKPYQGKERSQGQHRGGSSERRGKSYHF